MRKNRTHATALALMVLVGMAAVMPVGLAQEEWSSDIPTSTLMGPSVDVSVLNEGLWQKARDARAGEQMTFRLVGTIPGDVSNAQTISYAFVNEASEGLEIDVASVRVGHERVEAGIGSATSRRNVTGHFDVSVDGHLMHIVCANLRGLGSLAPADKIVVTYHATLRSTAKTGFISGNVNEARIVYAVEANEGEQPAAQRDDVREWHTSERDDAVVYAYRVAIDRRGSPANQALGGATFTLGGATQTTGDDGRVTFVGVGRGTSSVEEVSAPAGHSPVPPFEVEIIPSIENGTMTARLTSNDAKARIALEDVDARTGTVTVRVESDGIGTGTGVAESRGKDANTAGTASGTIAARASSRTRTPEIADPTPVLYPVLLALIGTALVKGQAAC